MKNSCTFQDHLSQRILALKIEMLNHIEYPAVAIVFERFRDFEEEAIEALEEAQVQVPFMPIQHKLAVVSNL